jgi:uncharacterized protein YlxW (UPF0749 family)
MGSEPVDMQDNALQDVSEMAKRPTSKEQKENHSVRLEQETLRRIDAVAKKLTERAAGVEVTRMATMRAAMLRGLEALENELGIKRGK